MIISGTVTSSPVQGATAPAAADSNPLTGFVPVGYNGQWQSKPFGVGGVAANITVTNSLALDWSTSTYFQYLDRRGEPDVSTFVCQSNDWSNDSGRYLSGPGCDPRFGLFGQPQRLAWAASERRSSITGGVDLFDVTCISQSTFYVNRLGGIA